MKTRIKGFSSVLQRVGRIEDGEVIYFVNEGDQLDGSSDDDSIEIEIEDIASLDARAKAEMDHVSFLLVWMGFRWSRLIIKNIIDRTASRGMATTQKRTIKWNGSTWCCLSIPTHALTYTKDMLMASGRKGLSRACDSVPDESKRSVVFPIHGPNVFNVVDICL